MNSKTLPNSVAERVENVLRYADLSPQKRRLLEFINAKPDSFTHEIGQRCAVGYPPARLWELNNWILPDYGLHLHCHAPKEWLKNRYGDVSLVHQWRLVMVPVGKGIERGKESAA